MLQRSYRAPDTGTYQNKYIDPWENDVKGAIDKYRKDNDLQGFKNYLKETMNKYKPQSKGGD